MALSRSIAAFALLALAAPVGAQAALRADAPRVLFTSTDSVKTDDGRRDRVTRTVTYHPVRGEYVDEMVDGGGRVLSRRVSPVSTAGPTPQELARARALVAAHPDIAPRIARAGGPVRVEGGFPLVREAGHACGPGGRCVTVDVFETAPGEPARRIRYAIVDLRTLTVLDADADPQADSNLAHPAARRQSRL
ncbi:hypothetical protein [Rubrivirga sp. IMCC45206]|uniref:hypothetical protein n=1 Tax=Rubrivirga sp. IMCC45206 TaxID=3391614 RepID=UPI0039902255